MARAQNTSRTLEQLEATPWPAALEGASPLVTRCHALRKIPIGSLSPGDLRVLIGQDVGTKHLMPLVLDILSQQPLVEGDYYPGDLLNAAMRIGHDYWSVHGEERARLRRVAERAMAELSSDEESSRSNRQLLRELQIFMASSDA